MRRRERVRGAIWPAHGTDGGPSRVPLLDQAARGVTTLMHEICGVCGYMVEMEMDHEAVHVRCYPMRPARNGEREDRVSFSYMGLSLRNILSTALVEIRTLNFSDHPIATTPREVVMWIPS